MSKNRPRVYTFPVPGPLRDRIRGRLPAALDRSGRTGRRRTGVPAERSPARLRPGLIPIGRRDRLPAAWTAPGGPAAGGPADRRSDLRPRLRPPSRPGSGRPPGPGSGRIPAGTGPVPFPPWIPSILPPGPAPFSPCVTRGRGCSRVTRAPVVRPAADSPTSLVQPINYQSIISQSICQLSVKILPWSFFPRSIIRYFPVRFLPFPRRHRPPDSGRLRSCPPRPPGPGIVILLAAPRMVSRRFPRRCFSRQPAPAPWGTAQKSWGTAQKRTGSHRTAAGDHRDPHNNPREPCKNPREPHESSRGLHNYSTVRICTPAAGNCKKIAGDLSPAKRLLFYSFVSSIAAQVSNQGHSRQDPSRRIPSCAMCMVLQPE